jgi:hypothetical protein
VKFFTHEFDHQPTTYHRCAKRKANMTTHTYKYVKFEPWKGKRYGRSKTGIKILVIGESHYWPRRPIPENLTQHVIGNVCSGEWPARATLAGIERTFGSVLPTVSGGEIWNEIAFYNYLQNWIGNNASDRPRQKEFHQPASVKGLIEVLYRLKPDLVVILGTGLFKVLSENEHGPPIRAGKAEIPTWLYQVGKTKNALVIGIKHPGKYYSSAKWAPIVKAGIRAAKVRIRKTAPERIAA